MLINSKHYASLIAQCITTKDLNYGKLLHSHFIKTSLIFNTFLSNRLIELYSKCGSIQSAHKVFYDVPVKNIRSWNTLISGYCKNGHFDHARNLLDEMPEPDIVSFNAIVSGLAHYGFYRESFGFLKRMQRLYGGLFLDEYTVVSAVSSCAILGAIRVLHQLHGVAVALGLEFDGVICNALIDAYGKCNRPDSSYAVFKRMVEPDVVSWTTVVAAFARASRMKDACRVFNLIPVKNTVSWTTLIAGFSQSGRGMEALKQFDKMQEAGVPPSAQTYVVVLGACADLAVSEKGKQLHSHLIRSNSGTLLLNLHVCNALMDMYCKCGDIRLARMLFERMPKKDTISWNSLITGFAQNGHNEESLALFERMITEKVKPNHVTFLGVLSACCHTGQVDESMRILKLMRKQRLKPGAEHYAVMIDLLGRNNRLDEALELIQRASEGSNHIGMWGALLAACRVHGNTDLAKKAADVLIMLEPSNTARYVMLSNIYAASNKWDDYRQVRKIMGARGLKKDAAFSWIEVKNTRHEFVAKDKSHCCWEDIYEVIHELVDQMREVRSPCIEIDLDHDELYEHAQQIN